jgi:23S rRNA (cytosine1962-C5)-methyltransferase
MKMMEINSISSLKSVLVNNINNGEKISFLFGAGISINTNNKPHKPNGVGLANDFINLFEKTIKHSKTPDNARRFFPEKEVNKLTTELKKTNNKYSTYAKFFDKCGIDVGKVFFKPVICEIKGFEEIKDVKEEKRIYEFLDDNFKLEKIELNKALTSLGKLLPLIDDDIKIYTSNIDPFIEIVAQRNGKKARSIHYHYEQKSTKKLNSHPFVVEHFHGYWLDRSLHENLYRENNTFSFYGELENVENLFVIGYEGWDDSMFEAIKKYLKHSKNHKCIIHWGFFSEDEEKIKANKIYKLLDQDSQQYLKLYKGVDANNLFDNVYLEVLNKKLDSYLDKSVIITNPNNNISFDSIPFKYSLSFTSRLIGRTNNDNVISFIYNRFLMKKKVGISSKFGLGKTTLLKEVSNHIISTKERLPININLRDKQVSELTNKEIYSLILSEIESIVKSSLKNDSKVLDNFFLKNRKEILNVLKEKFIKNELVLILDGIDESNYRNNNFSEIVDNLKNIEHPFIFSFRTEFHKLLDCFIDKSNDLSSNDFISIELKEWDLENSSKYIISIFDNEETVNELKKNYPTLLKRPIFLNLIKVVYSEGDALSNDNISDLFYKFLRTNIYSNLETFIKDNSLKVSKTTLGRELYYLIIEIAISLYLEYRHFIEKSNSTFIPKISFNKETLRLIISKYKYLNPNIFIKFIEFSEINKEYGLFKKQNNHYTFFHRSLFDYLVANGAAKSIIKNGKCSNAWNVYQTDEISEYFVNEIENIKKISDQEERKVIKRNIINAFNKELSVLDAISQEKLNELKLEKDKVIENLIDKSETNILQVHQQFQRLSYSEKLEEVIFYCGKYYTDNSITNKLELIHNNKYFFPPKYFRTTAITLSRLYNIYGKPNGTKYIKNLPIYNYLARVFYDLTTPTEMFYKLQSRIDVEYYGKEELYKKSLQSVNNLINNKDIEEFNPLDLLKTFSFFLTLKIQSKKDYTTKKNLIKKLRRGKYTGDTRLFKNFIESVDFMFYRKSYSFRNENLLNNNSELLKIIKTAIQKRKPYITSDNNVIRLFNGSGDGLDSLFIDYFNKHIVIQLDTGLLDEKTEIIKNALLDVLKPKLINSINIKYTWWENKREDIPPKNIFGLTTEKIICSENGLKFYVDITSSKTGFFIDNRNIRNYISKNSKGKNILNLCSFTATLGCIAKMNDCKNVINLEKFESNNIIGKKNYELNSINYKEDEFITDIVQNINEICFKEKFDIIILDFPEISVLPTFYRKSHNTYLNENENVLNLLSDNGILITTCCSHGFNRERYNKMIEELTTRNDLIEISNDLEKLYDHPINERNDYLKIKILKKH